MKTRIEQPCEAKNMSKAPVVDRNISTMRRGKFRIVRRDRCVRTYRGYADAHGANHNLRAWRKGGRGKPCDGAACSCTRLSGRQICATSILFECWNLIEQGHLHRTGVFPSNGTCRPRTATKARETAGSPAGQVFLRFTISGNFISPKGGG